MQVALSVREGRISPLFDASRRLLIADVKGHAIITKRYESFNCNSASLCAAWLDDLGIKVLICDGISDYYANHIKAHGIEIIPYFYGDIDDVLLVYFKKT